MSAKPLLHAETITKKFPGVVALKDVSFDLLPGEIHAICGENGAGKSTFIKLLSGIHPYGSYEGRLAVNGQPAKFASVADAEAAGIAVIYQELALVPEMSVAENLFLGAEPTRFGLIDWDRVYRESKQLLEPFHLKIDPGTKTEKLGVGQRQLLEIIKAIRKKTKILILDEPTAALAEAEVAYLLKTLKDLQKRGIASIYISHKLDEVLEVADRITVFRDGSSVATAKAKDADKSWIIRHMVGREIKDMFPPRKRAAGEAALKVEGLTAADNTGATILKDISFEVRRGEVLGIGGLMGAGRSELLMHLFGAWGRRRRGTVKLGGQTLKPGDPRESIRRGMILVTEDRRRFGLVLDASVGFNLSLSTIHRLCARGFIDREREFRASKKVFDSLHVKAPGLESWVGGLSGGNQQKVVLGKAMLTEPSVFLLDEPTRGIDVGAKQEIYEIIDRLTEAGNAVVVVSSEMPELMGLSDRILIIHEGGVGGEFGKKATQEQLLAAALGHSARRS